MLHRPFPIGLLFIHFLVLSSKTTECLLQHGSFQYRPKKVSTVLHVDPTAMAAAAAVAFVGGGGIWLGGADERAQKAKYAEWDVKNRAVIAERERLAYIQPKDFWTEEELSPYNGLDETGPLLFAADGKIFNVSKGRHFYGPGCEYHIFAGRDATRLLAKQKLDEETEEEKKVDLSVAEKAVLQGWLYTFKSKYQVVGKLEGFNPKTTSF